MLTQVHLLAHLTTQSMPHSLACLFALPLTHYSQICEIFLEIKITGFQLVNILFTFIGLLGYVFFKIFKEKVPLIVSVFLIWDK